MKKLRLLTPGPTEVPPEVLAAMAAPIIHHRSAPARERFARVQEMLRRLFFTRRPVHVLTGSGTAGMEAAVVNHFSPGEEVIVIQAGKFGRRWGEIARAYGLTVQALEAEWGEVVPAEQLAQVMANHPRCRGVLATHVETSTGTLFDVRAFAEVVDRSEALLVVDAVASLGAVAFNMDDWGVDVAVSASQKALMLPPGLALVCASERAEKRWEQAQSARFYLDLRASRRAMDGGGTAFTPALSLWAGLEKALEMIHAQGLENIWRETERLAAAARAGVSALGLPPLSQSPAPSVTAARLPDAVDGRRLVELLQERLGLYLGGGQDQLAGRIVRISHMGACDRLDVLAALAALEAGLAELGRAVAPGAGVAAAVGAFATGA
ncbi:alanine--glyoxylate aminotransferase family protein [bacterium]|nr:alanine--glyoxylate aminotransferase family protein [bacterium]